MIEIQPSRRRRNCAALVPAYGIAGPRWPSWLASAVLHALFMVVLALALRGWARPADNEPPREAGIVLAQRQASGPTRYLSQADVQAQAQERSDSVASDQQIAAALPRSDAGDALIQPRVDLPGASAAEQGSGALLADASQGVARQPRAVVEGDDDSILANDPIRNAPPGPTGPPAEVKLFGASAAGRSFVFVIDRSRSMGPLLVAAERELKQALAPLSSEQRFQIIGYNQQPVAMQAKAMADATPESKAEAARFLTQLAPVGSTNHYFALLAALRLAPDVVFLLTDADPPLTPSQIREVTVEAGMAAIHCIQFGEGPLGEEESFLQTLARLNHGTFTYVDLTKQKP